MTPAQWRVLVILFIAASIDVGYNPTSTADLQTFIKNISHADTNSLTYVRHEAAWILGALALIVLTGVADTLGTWIAVIILAGAAFGHGSQIASTIEQITGAVNPNQNVKKIPEQQRTTIG